MDEILLTPEEQENAANRGPDDDWTNICRAQVRQFHLWLMTHWQSAKKLDGAVQLTISEADWAALKAAVEGK